MRNNSISTRLGRNNPCEPDVGLCTSAPCLGFTLDSFDEKKDLHWVYLAMMTNIQ